MKKLFIIWLFLFPYLTNNAIAQRCDSRIYIDEYLENQFVKDIKDKLSNPESVKAYLKSTAKKLKMRSGKLSFKVLVVNQNQKLSLSKAAEILNDCVGNTNDCSIEFIIINQTPINAVFTKSSDGQTMLNDLLITAYLEKWYDEADLVIGIVNTPMDVYDGYAYIGSCSNSIAKALVIEANSPNSLLAHEIGHTLGMLHDDNNRLPNSVMLPFVPYNPDQISLKNKSCYFTSTNCPYKGVEDIKISGEDELLSNKVSWTTNDEIKIEGYHVERSVNNQGWEKIGFEKSNPQRSYVFRDNNPQPITTYRLRYIGLNDKNFYSYSITIQRSNKLEARILSNPFENNLEIQIDVFSKPHTINIYSPNGMLILGKQYNGGLQRIDFSQYSSGLYIVEIISDTKKIIKRVMKF
jgi:hypothetical protein